jgi:hypothetical protein
LKAPPESGCRPSAIHQVLFSFPFFNDSLHYF